MPRFARVLAVAFVLACGPAPAGTGAIPAGTGTSEPATTGSPTTTGTEHSSTGGSSSSGGGDFIAPPDVPVHHDPCDPWRQDCPDGQRCVPWAPSGSGQWTHAKCVDIIGDQAPGEPCTAPEGGIAGVDDCALGSFCWDVDAENHGVCFLQCAGTSDSPICPPNAVCGSDQYLVLALCLARCDPLGQDCPATETCVQNGGEFLCYRDHSGDEGQFNDPCGDPKECDQGLDCIEAATAASACDARMPRCCQPYCQLPDGACPNPDQQCLPLQATVPGHEDVGICSLPA